MSKTGNNFRVLLDSFIWVQLESYISNKNFLQIPQIDSTIPTGKVGLQLNCKQTDTLKGKEKGEKKIIKDFQN